MAKLKTNSGNDKIGDIRIQRIPSHHMDDLHNIKEHMGIGIGNFIKSKIPSLIESYYKEFPSHRPQKKDTI